MPRTASLFVFTLPLRAPLLPPRPTSITLLFAPPRRGGRRSSPCRWSVTLPTPSPLPFRVLSTATAAGLVVTPRPPTPIPTPTSTPTTTAIIRLPIRLLLSLVVSRRPCEASFLLLYLTARQTGQDLLSPPQFSVRQRFGTTAVPSPTTASSISPISIPPPPRSLSAASGGRLPHSLPSLSPSFLRFYPYLTDFAARSCCDLPLACPPPEKMSVA